MCAYAYLQRWFSTPTISEYTNDQSNSALDPQPLPKTQVFVKSRIPRLIKNIAGNDIAWRSTVKAVYSVTELREETNIKIEKLEKMLDEIHQKLTISQDMH